MAAAALRRTRSQAAIQPLGVALDEIDSEVRDTAVVALNEITGRHWMLADWKKWLRDLRVERQRR
jgi:HEAT repeat protein